MTRADLGERPAARGHHKRPSSLRSIMFERPRLPPR